MEIRSDSSPQWKSFLATWHRDRHLARTDLLWLCTEVLGNTLISREVHGPILEALQKFPGADEEHSSIADYTAARAGRVLWKPKCRMELLPVNEGCVASRQMLLLYPRGHAKSTVATVAHSVQWILNYPNVRILISTATEDLGIDFIREIRNHFISNEKLRYLFPELCPQSRDGKVPELGNQGGFEIPGRDPENHWLGPGGKDKTVRLGTVGSAITGYHGDVFKSDDLVEKINSSSQGGIDDVIRHFGAMGDLLEAYVTADGPRPGWHDVIGTPWDFSDLYQVIRNDEDKRRSEGLPPMWNICLRSAAPNWPEGPALWPEKMGIAELRKIENDPTKGPAQLSAQYLMNPIVPGTGLIDDIKGLNWIDREEMDGRVAGLVLRARLDLAGMDPSAKGIDNDYTCLTVGGFGDGTLYLPWMRHGRPPTEEVVEWMFDVFKRFPQLVELRVEKASGAVPVEAWFRRECAARDIWPPVTFVTRSNRESKQNRIKALRPWFMNADIVFGGNLRPYRTSIEAEVKGFPKFKHDDILDTISDLMNDTKGAVSGAVMTNRVPVPGSMRDPISIILARMSSEQNYTSNGVDNDTGFPCA